MLDLPSIFLILLLSILIVLVTKELLIDLFGDKWYQDNLDFDKRANWEFVAYWWVIMIAGLLVIFGTML